MSHRMEFSCQSYDNTNSLLEPSLFHLFIQMFLQVFADPVGKTIADRDQAIIVAGVQNRLTIRESPDVITEAAERLPHFPVSPGIVDYSLYLTWRADHTLCF